MTAGRLALVFVTAFTSAAAYINLIEQPARLDVEPGALLVQWRRSYERGAVVQITLSVAAAVSGVVAFVNYRDGRWLAGAATLFALLPYTLAVVMPVNHRLLAMSAGSDDARIRDEVLRWGRVHAGRTLLGGAATVLYFAAAA